MYDSIFNFLRQESSTSMVLDTEIYIQDMMKVMPKSDSTWLSSSRRESSYSEQVDDKYNPLTRRE